MPSYYKDIIFRRNVAEWEQEFICIFPITKVWQGEEFVLGYGGIIKDYKIISNLLL